jgi:hypothetical protein
MSHVGRMQKVAAPALGRLEGLAAHWAITLALHRQVYDFLRHTVGEMPETRGHTPAAKATRADSETLGSVGRAKSSRAKQGHFLTTREREVLRNPVPLQSTPIPHGGPKAERARRDQASASARAKRKALTFATAALEDLAFLGATMDSEWWYEVATHVEPLKLPVREEPLPGVTRSADEIQLEVAQALQADSTLARFLEAISEKVGLERAPEVEPMMDPHNLSLWPAGYTQRGPVVLQRRGAALISLWLAALERGLNAAERGRQIHTVTDSIRAPTPPVAPALGFPKGRRRLPRGEKKPRPPPEPGAAAGRKGR